MLEQELQSFILATREINSGNTSLKYYRLVLLSSLETKCSITKALGDASVYDLTEDAYWCNTEVTPKKVGINCIYYNVEQCELNVNVCQNYQAHAIMIYMCADLFCFLFHVIVSCPSGGSRIFKGGFFLSAAQIIVLAC